MPETGKTLIAIVEKSLAMDHIVGLGAGKENPTGLSKETGDGGLMV